LSVLEKARKNTLAKKKMKGIKTLMGRGINLEHREKTRTKEPKFKVKARPNVKKKKV